MSPESDSLPLPNHVVRPYDLQLFLAGLTHQVVLFSCYGRQILAGQVEPVGTWFLVEGSADHLPVEK